MVSAPSETARPTGIESTRPPSKKCSPSTSTGGSSPGTAHEASTAGTTGPLLIALRDVRWASDARIDGTVRWDRSSGWVLARLAVHPASGAEVRLTARWRPFGAQDQPAVIHGRAGAHRLAATSPAP